MRVDELSVALLDAELAAEQALVLLLPVAADYLVLLGDEPAEVDLEASAGEARITGTACVVDEPRRLDEVLRGQAAAVDAGAAHGTLLGHEGRLAELLRPERRGEGRRAGAENEEVGVRVSAGHDLSI